MRAGAGLSAQSRHTNRIHRDDAAAAIVHLLLRPEQPAPLYLGVDNEPVRSDEVLSFLAAELGLPEPALNESEQPTRTRESQRGGDKLLNNQLLRDTGFTFTYPTYREGYRAMLAGLGIRHP